MSVTVFARFWAEVVIASRVARAVERVKECIVANVSVWRNRKVGKIGSDCSSGVVVWCGVYPIDVPRRLYKHPLLHPAATTLIP